MPILRKEIHPSLLPVLARAQWNLAAHIMRRAHGGDLISKTALKQFRFLAECTESLVELCTIRDGRYAEEEIYVVSFYDSVNASYVDRALIDWAVEFTAEDDPDNREFKELRDDWPATEWKEWGR